MKWEKVFGWEGYHEKMGRKIGVHVSALIFFDDGWDYDPNSVRIVSIWEGGSGFEPFGAVNNAHWAELGRWFEEKVGAKVLVMDWIAEREKK